jgi:glycerol-3-phosphate responsive antiterminator
MEFSPFSANEDIFGVQYKQTMLIRLKKDHAFGQIIKCRTIGTLATLQHLKAIFQLFLIDWLSFHKSLSTFQFYHLTLNSR